MPAAPESNYDLRGQVAIVTGGGRGLGRAFAQELARAGVAVAVTARTKAQVDETADMICAAGGRAAAFVADATDPEAAASVVRATEERFGPVDILVNNAGVMHIGTVHEADIGEWWRTLEINLKGPFIWSKAVLPGMIARRRGRIINISSGGAHYAHAHASAYCASKAALSHFTRCFAAEVKDLGITVIAYAPDALTDLSRQIYETDSSMPLERRARYQQNFESDPETLMAQSLRGFMFVASGRADGLTGRHISRRDDPVAILSRTDEILKNDELIIQRVPLPGSVHQ